MSSAERSESPVQRPSNSTSLRFCASLRLNSPFNFEYYDTPSESAAGEERLWWGPAILLWLAGSAIGWAIFIGIGWAVLQAF